MPIVRVKKQAATKSRPATRPPAPMNSAGLTKREFMQQAVILNIQPEQDIRRLVVAASTAWDMVEQRLQFEEAEKKGG